MAGKTKEMSQIKQLLQMHQQGCPIKKIARTLGMSKNTAKGYLRKLAANGYTCGKPIKTDVPLLAKQFHAGNPAYKDGYYGHLEQRFAYFEKEHKRISVTRYLLWTEYLTEIPSGYDYTQFNEHPNRYLQRGRPRSGPLCLV